MAKDQDCFKIEKALKKQADDFAKSKGMSRGTLYRTAIIEYMQKHSWKP